MFHSAAQYQQQIEQFYLALIYQLLNQGYTKLDVGLLHAVGRQSPFANLLLGRFQNFGLDCRTAWEIELAVLQSLTSYIQTVQQTTASKLMGLNCLSVQSPTLGLQPTTLETIHSLLIADNCQRYPSPNGQLYSTTLSYRPNSQGCGCNSCGCNGCGCNGCGCNGCGCNSCGCNGCGCTTTGSGWCQQGKAKQPLPAKNQGWYYARLRQYDAALVQAIKQFGPDLNCAADQQLKCLQNQLGIADHDLIAPTEIRSAGNRIDYTELWRLLKAQNWQQANELTWRLITEAKGRNGAISIENIASFPCQDLLTIDHLWMRFSCSQFCFSTQRQIWWRCQDPNLFARQVGWVYQDNSQTQVWRSAANLKFSLQAEQGHLPFLPHVIKNRRYQDFTKALLNRLDCCPIMA
jgi:hypothetical protein